MANFQPRTSGQTQAAAGVQHKIDAHEKGLIALGIILLTIVGALITFYTTFHADVVEIHKQLATLYKDQNEYLRQQEEKNTKAQEKIIELYKLAIENETHKVELPPSKKLTK